MAEVIISLVIGIVVGAILTYILLRKSKPKTPLEDENFKNAFQNLATEALRTNNEDFIRLANQNLETILEKTKNEFGKQAIKETLEPLQKKLQDYDAEIKRIEQERNQQYGGIKSMVKGLVESTNKLDKETLALVNTLKRPEARGHLGEITLRRVLELTGLEDHYSFIEQVTAEGESRLRADVIVEMPNNHRIIIDSKVTLKPLLDAYEETDDERREAKINEYGRKVKDKVKELASKAYWKEFDGSAEFVIMFLPGESFYFEAVRQQPDMIEWAMEQNVVIVTPATMLALLRTVAMEWEKHDISENAKKIASMGTELYERICTFASYYNKLALKLSTFTKAFNDSVGSFSSRVMPSARKLKDLACPATRDQLNEPSTIDTGIREIPEEE